MIQSTPSSTKDSAVSREDLIALLNEDLAREYQALIFTFANECEAVRNYGHRIRQCEQLREYAVAERLRTILRDAQDRLISLATALGVNPPKIDHEMHREAMGAQGDIQDFAD